MTDIYTEFAPESAAIAAYLREACAIKLEAAHMRADAYWRNADEDESYVIWAKLGYADNGDMPEAFVPKAIMADFRAIADLCSELLA